MATAVIAKAQLREMVLSEARSRPLASSVLRRALFETVAKRVSGQVPLAGAFRTWCARGFCQNVDATAVIEEGIRLPRRFSAGKGALVGNRSMFLGAGHVRIGDRVRVGPRCLFITGDHPVPGDDGRFDNQASVHRDITVGDGAFLGAAAVLLPGVTVGAGAVIAPGAVVVKSVAPNGFVMGNPANDRQGHA